MFRNSDKASLRNEMGAVAASQMLNFKWIRGKILTWIRWAAWNLVLRRHEASALSLLLNLNLKLLRKSARPTTKGQASIVGLCLLWDEPGLSQKEKKNEPGFKWGNADLCAKKSSYWWSTMYSRLNISRKLWLTSALDYIMVFLKQWKQKLNLWLAW